jgi:hypothetical protein
MTLILPRRLVLSFLQSLIKYNVNMNTKRKGDLLEDITAELCGNINDAKVSKRIKVKGKFTGTEREIDVLIEGKFGVFNARIVVESKNYNKPVGIEKVEALNSKLKDVSADLGVMVSSKGFTGPAKDRAKSDGIQLYEAYDERLGNSNLFIPLRCVDAIIKSYQVTFQHRVVGPFSMSQDRNDWRFKLDNKVFSAHQLATYAWNRGMIPQKGGRHKADFGAIIMFDRRTPDKIQYCEVSLSVVVIEKYYLKLFPASYLENSNTANKKFNLFIDWYSKEPDRIANGWKRFSNFEELNKAADIENQPDEIKELLIRPKGKYGIDWKDSSELHPEVKFD